MSKITYQVSIENDVQVCPFCNKLTIDTFRPSGNCFSDTHYYKWVTEGVRLTEGGDPYLKLLALEATFFSRTFTWIRSTQLMTDYNENGIESKTTLVHDPISHLKNLFHRLSKIKAFL